MSTSITMALTMDKFINMRMKKYGTIEECYRDDEIDAVLIPDEFLDEESIQEALDACTIEAWDYVRANRHQYSMRIRKLIEPNDFRPSLKKTKMKIREMSDKDIETQERLYREKKMKEFEPKWEEIQKNLPDRSEDELDDQLDEAWDALNAARNRMTEYLEKRKKKYIPSYARKEMDEEQEEIEEEINECEAAYDEIEKRISEADKKYFEEKKNEYFEKWLLQV